MNKLLFHYKTAIVLVFSTTVLMTVSSFKKSEESKLFQKIVWSEIEINTDSTLFKPYARVHMGDFYSMTENFNYDAYQSFFKERTDNLWYIIHPRIIDGRLMMYSSFDPNNFTYRDEGDLRFPITDNNDNSNNSPVLFMKDPETKEIMLSYLGKWETSTVPLMNMNGEDSISYNADGSVNVMYPDPQFVWTSDRDIVKYKVRERVWLNKNGIEKKRMIEAIAPVVYRKDEADVVIGEFETFWINYNSLKPFIKDAYYIDPNGKPNTFLDYFEKRKFVSKFLKEEKVVEKSN